MKKIALAATALVLGSPAVAAPLENGSFETPVITTSPTYYPAAPGVTFTGGGAGIEPNGGAFGYAAAPDGKQIGFLQSGGTISFGLTGLTAGTSYLVNLLTAARPGFATGTVAVTFGAFGLGTFTPTSASFTAVTPFSFLATSGTGSLNFTNISAVGDTNAAIDAVTVAAAVPEPATWGMMLLGFGAMGFAMRRRAKVRTNVSFA